MLMSPKERDSFSIVIFFLLCVIYICVHLYECVSMCVGVPLPLHIYEDKRTIYGVVSLLLCGPWGNSMGRYSLQQIPLLAKPFHVLLIF